LNWWPEFPKWHRRRSNLTGGFPEKGLLIAAVYYMSKEKKQFSTYQKGFSRSMGQVRSNCFTNKVVEVAH